MSNETFNLIAIAMIGFAIISFMIVMVRLTVKEQF
jgi:hypothetical protein